MSLPLLECRTLEDRMVRSRHQCRLGLKMTLWRRLDASKPRSRRWFGRLVQWCQAYLHAYAKAPSYLASNPAPDYAIVELVKNNFVKHVVSQNVDGLHIRSGFLFFYYIYFIDLSVFDFGQDSRANSSRRFMELPLPSTATGVRWSSGGALRSKPSDSWRQEISFIIHRT